MQVLRNLVANASSSRRPARSWSAPTRTAASVRFTVRDTGHRDRAGDLDRIFEEFVQVPGALQRSGRGTGLGLALCKRLVELLGGRISVTSALGEGSTFEVSLPGGRPDRRSRRRSPIPPGRCSSSTTTSRRATSCAPISAASAGRSPRSRPATAALAACERGVPAAIVLDLSMPDVDGTVEVLARLRAGERTRAIPVVVHTSRAIERRRARADRGARRAGPGQVDHLRRRRCGPPSPRRSEDQRGA